MKLMSVCLLLVLASCGEKELTPTSGREPQCNAGYQEVNGWFRFQSNNRECIGQLGSNWAECRGGR